MNADQNRWIVFEGREMRGEVSWEAGGSISGAADATEAIALAAKRWRDLSAHEHVRALPWSSATEADRQLASEEDGIRDEEYGRAMNVSVATLMLGVAGLLFDELQTAEKIVRSHASAAGLDDVGVRARLQHYYIFLVHHWVTREVEKVVPDWLLSDILKAFEGEIDKLHEFDMLTGATPSDLDLVRSRVGALRKDFTTEFAQYDLSDSNDSLDGTLYFEFARRVASLCGAEENEVVGPLMVHAKACLGKLHLSECFAEVRLLLPGTT